MERGRLGRYEVVFPMAHDERSTVFVARIHGSETPYYAVRLLGRRVDGFASTVLDDARPALTLRHRNVVHLLEAIDAEQGTLLAMEYIPGDSLAGLSARARSGGGRVPRDVGLRLLLDALAGLHALHDHVDADGTPLGLFHGGLTAASVFVGTDGVARITGVGVARDLGVSPEQLAGRVPYDRRCDVWAAGALAWELVSGRPFAGTSASPDGPPNLRSVATDISDDLANAVGRALHPDRDQRTRDAETFARDLAEALRAPGMLAHPDDARQLARRLIKPKLDEHRAQLAEARRIQQTRPASIPDVRTMIGGAGPPPLKRLPLPDLPVEPMTHDDGASELRIEVPKAQRTERANVDVLGPPSAPPPPVAEPEIIRSPFALGDEDAAGPVSELFRSRKLVILASGALTVSLLVLVIARCGGDHAPPTTDTGRPREIIVSADSSPVPSPTTPATTEAPAPPAESPEESAPQLVLTANAPIATVQLGGRLVDAVVPAPTLSVDLGPEEAAAALHLVVVATDGRVATLTTNAGELQIEVLFGDKPRPRRPRPPTAPPPPTSSPRKPSPKRL